VNQTKPEVPVRQWGSIQHGAQLFSCSERTIRRKVAAGELTAYRLGARMIRIDLNELERLLRPIPTGGTSAA
jgi:excisionase family DNA binding protein